MEYNTEKPRLKIAEYGRNIQRYVEHSKTITNSLERQAFIEQVIELMHQITPVNKNLDEKKTRLWNHFFEIAGYDIDVVVPEGVVIKPVTTSGKPFKIKYPSNTSDNRHFGTRIQLLIDKAIALEDLEKKKEFTTIIASYMKTALRNSNGQYINDDFVKNELHKMSGGELSIEDGTILDNPSGSNGYDKRRNYNPRNNTNRNGKYRNNNNRNNNFKKRK